MENNSPIMDANTLNGLSNNRVRIVDVRWYLLKDKQGYQEYLRGHIPGAVFMDLDRDLSAPAVQGPGRHPLPSSDAFAQMASRAGIGSDTLVVAYDDTGGGTAARLWWLLRYFGHTAVAVLDGGLTHWVAEGHPLESGENSPAPATFVPHAQPNWIVDQGEVDVLRLDPRVLVLDVRAAERYEGRVEPVDPKAGHIPGAKNLPIAGNLRGPNDLRFQEPAALRSRFEHSGTSRVDKIVSYCGSGVNACQNILALHLAGYESTLLYPGSWSDWCSNSDRPIATGVKPQ